MTEDRGLKTEDRPARPLCVRHLGLVSYGEAHELQQELVEQRRGGRIPDTLLLLEHPHVVTLGVRTHAHRGNILASDDVLSTHGVEIHETRRGGDVTYHGPGQLVGYPILDLRPDRCDVHRYVRDLEEVLIRTVRDYGVESTRIPGLSGVWTMPPVNEKIAAIGVRIARWITSHGFALNVNTNLDFFQLIVPCGIRDRGVTSLRRALAREVSLDEVACRVTEHFCDVFGCQEIPSIQTTGSSKSEICART